MKTLLCSLLILLGVPAFGATVKYYDDTPNNPNPGTNYIISLQTGDKSIGGTPYNFWTLGQMVAWLQIRGLTNGGTSINIITNNILYSTNIYSTTIITTNISSVYQTNQISYITNLYSTTTYVTNLTSQYITNNVLYTTNVTFTIAKGGNLTITTNLTVNNLITTNVTIVVPGGFTNLNATPKTVAWWDSGDGIGSIPNASGFLTNDGVGNIGWNTVLAVTELDAQNAYLTNTFIFITNKFAYPNGDGQLVGLANAAGVLENDGSGGFSWVVGPPPGGSAGGVLSGTYPNPGFANYDGKNYTNESFALNTNNVGGAAFVFGGPGTAATLYDTNITAATTLKLFDITACGSTAGGIKLYVTCSGGTDRILTFPSGCSGAGLGTPPAVTITNAKAAFFDIIYKPGETPVTNVFWSPVY